MADQVPGKPVTSGSFTYVGGSVYVPDELYVCGQCGEYRGTLRAALSKPSLPKTLTITCICDGILCPRCKTNKIRRPVSDNIHGGQVWHTPHFAGMAGCRECQKKASSGP